MGRRWRLASDGIRETVLEGFAVWSSSLHRWVYVMRHYYAWPHGEKKSSNGQGFSSSTSHSSYTSLVQTTTWLKYHTKKYNQPVYAGLTRLKTTSRTRGDDRSASLETTPVTTYAVPPHAAEPLAYQLPMHDRSMARTWAAVQ